MTISVNADIVLSNPRRDLVCPGQEDIGNSNFNGDVVPAISASGQSEKHVILKCTCREKVMVREGCDLILKSRIVKISEGVAKAKCKRCDQWVIVPIKMA